MWDKNEVESCLQAAVPDSVKEILARLEAAGFEAWAVGGCIRDVLLGKEAHDWDLCSSASPEQVAELFSEQQILPTGIEHGTVMLLWKGQPYELTMFRQEQDYDGRRPHTVTAARSLAEDVQRRDFTINSMAYSPQRGFCDLCNGRTDLEQGLIRCVGKAEQRFREDYLRILRALRFAACYPFTMEQETAEALQTCSTGLACLSGERIWQELSRLLCGRYAGRVLSRYAAVLQGIGTEWADFQLREEAGKQLEQLPCHLEGRLACLLFSQSKREMILERLRCPTESKKRVRLIWQQAEDEARWIATEAEETRVRQCCWLSHWSVSRRRTDSYFACCCRQIREEVKTSEISPMSLQWQQAKQWYEESVFFMETQPLDLCDLAVKGNDLLTLGLAFGPQIGRTLHDMQEAVWAGQVVNEKTALLTWLETSPQR